MSIDNRPEPTAATDHTRLPEQTDYTESTATPTRERTSDAERILAAERPLTPEAAVSSLHHDPGHELKSPPPDKMKPGNDVPVTANEGLQTRAPDDNRPFQDVVPTTAGDPEYTYLYTLDPAGLHLALEATPGVNVGPHGDAGSITHTNISDRAYVGGQAWFHEPTTPGDQWQVTIDPGSGRFGTGNALNHGAYDAAIAAFARLGYHVIPTLPEFRADAYVETTPPESPIRLPERDAGR